MTDYEMMEKVFSHLPPDTRDWHYAGPVRIGPNPSAPPTDDKELALMGEQVGFVFNPDGSIKGVYNWKW